MLQFVVVASSKARSIRGRANWTGAVEARRGAITTCSWFESARKVLCIRIAPQIATGYRRRRRGYQYTQRNTGSPPQLVPMRQTEKATPVAAAQATLSRLVQYDFLFLDPLYRYVKKRREVIQHSGIESGKVIDSHRDSAVGFPACDRRRRVFCCTCVKARRVVRYPPR